MKTILLTTITSLSLQLNAQTYLPIPESNAVWIEAKFNYFVDHEHSTTTIPLSFGNDSVISGNTYKTLHGHSIQDWIDNWGNQATYQEGTNYFPYSFKLAFRQDIPNKQVFQWDVSSNQEALLYDFGNLVVGQPYPQTITNMDYPLIKVMAYDSVLLNDGIYHERWTLGSNASDSGFVSIIEGVGSTLGFDLPIAIPFEQTSRTLCMSINQTPVFDGWSTSVGPIHARYSENCKANVSIEENSKKTTSVAVWPVPSTDFITVKSEDEIIQLEIIDLLGNQLIKQANVNDLEIEISIKDLPSGNYFIKVYLSNGETMIKKIIR